MYYKAKINLPQGWETEESQYIEEDGTEVFHLECALPDDKAQTDIAEIDLYVGAMPPDSTAADQALVNYADLIGFEDDEEEDPIIEWPFAGKKAYGFEAYCEGDVPMRVMCYEIKKGILVVMSIVGQDDQTLIDTIQIVERGLRLKNEA